MAEAALAPGLYLVATPIGNLEDITLRALRVLKQVDRIACEDTRQTQKLLNHFGIQTPTVSYHLFNEQARSQELVAELKAGGRIAVVSDAGTPGIADPGGQIAAAAIAAGRGSVSDSGGYGRGFGADCEWAADGVVCLSWIFAFEVRGAADRAGRVNGWREYARVL